MTDWTIQPSQTCSSNGSKQRSRIESITRNFRRNKEKDVVEAPFSRGPRIDLGLHSSVSVRHGLGGAQIQYSTAKRRDATRFSAKPKMDSWSTILLSLNPLRCWRPGSVSCNIDSVFPARLPWPSLVSAKFTQLPRCPRVSHESVSPACPSHSPTRPLYSCLLTLPLNVIFISFSSIQSLVPRPLVFWVFGGG